MKEQILIGGQEERRENVGWDFATEISRKDLPTIVLEVLDSKLAEYANSGEFGKLNIDAYRKLERKDGNRYLMKGRKAVLPGDMPMLESDVIVVIETSIDKGAGPYRGGAAEVVTRSEIVSG